MNKYFEDIKSIEELHQRYRELLKSVGCRFAPKKKCWRFHYGDYVRYHKGEVSLDEIRQKYGSKKVNSKSKQYAIG